MSRIVCKFLGHTKETRNPWWQRRCRRCGVHLHARPVQRTASPCYCSWTRDPDCPRHSNMQVAR